MLLHVISTDKLHTVVLPWNQKQHALTLTLASSNILIHSTGSECYHVSSCMSKCQLTGDTEIPLRRTLVQQKQ